MSARTAAELAAELRADVAKAIEVADLLDPPRKRKRRRRRKAALDVETVRAIAEVHGVTPEAVERGKHGELVINLGKVKLADTLKGKE